MAGAGSRGGKARKPGREVSPPPGLEASRITVGGEELALLTFPMPPPAFPATFSAAERAIARSVLEGRSNAAIAAERNTSVRTVANQIGAMFRKLGVHSRTEFVVAVGGARAGARSNRSGP